MSKYSTLTAKMKEEIVTFSEKISKGLGKPEQKLVSNMLYGISAAESCVLTEIGRALHEEIKLKKTEERLARGLRNFDDSDTLLRNFEPLAKAKLGNVPVFAVDISDLTKPYGQAFEGLAKVHDGSTGELENGYWTLEIAALTDETKTPISLYDRVYSTMEDGFMSQNDELFKALRYIRKSYGQQGIRTLDRGFDSNIVYEYFLKAGEDFIIRADKQRHVTHKGKTRNILAVANSYKGKYRMDFTGKKGEKLECKLSVIPIRLPAHPSYSLNMIVVYGLGKEPMMLVTNLPETDKRLANTVAKVYLMRWRVEEHFRFKKQQFALEGFRVRSLKAIRTLHRLVMLLSGFVGLLADKHESSMFVAQLIHIARRINRSRKYWNYAIADGIAALLRLSRTGLRARLKPKPKLFRPTQLLISGWCVLG
jgi:hypothetical protein